MELPNSTKDRALWGDAIAFRSYLGAIPCCHPDSGVADSTNRQVLFDFANGISIGTKMYAKGYP